METTQMLKGILEGCILAIISKKEVYGYEMTNQLSRYGLGMVSEGSIYPVLLKLQRQKYIEGIMKPSIEGPMRKYYHLTPQGRKYLKAFMRQWSEMSQGVERILAEIGEE